MRQVFKYSIKVWLTSVALAPILYSLTLLVVDRQSILVVFAYAGPVAIVTYGILITAVSMLPWLIYFLTIWLLTRFTDSFKSTEWLTTVFAELILMASFGMLYILDDSPESYLFYLMFVCFSVVLGTCTRFYKLKM
jgi:hypothetical protein